MPSFEESPSNSDLFPHDIRWNFRSIRWIHQSNQRIWYYLVSVFCEQTVLKICIFRGEFRWRIENQNWCYLTQRKPAFHRSPILGWIVSMVNHHNKRSLVNPITLSRLTSSQFVALERICKFCRSLFSLQNSEIFDRIDYSKQGLIIREKVIANYLKKSNQM